MGTKENSKTTKKKPVKTPAKKPTKKKKKSPGAPTKYNANVQKKADSYIVRYKTYGDKVPTVCGLACVLGVVERTLYNWGDANPAFLQTLERIQATQKRGLVNGGLSGDFHPTIAKLMLSNHGMHEKNQIEHSGEVKTDNIDYSNLTGEELDTMRRLADKARNQKH